LFWLLRLGSPEAGFNPCWIGARARCCAKHRHRARDGRRAAARGRLSPNAATQAENENGGAFAARAAGKSLTPRAGVGSSG